MTQDNWITIAFVVLAIGMIGSAFAVVALPRIVHSALALVVFFLNIAGIYVLLQAEFIAAVQVIVYVGAVTVLFLFAIMLTHHSYAPDSNPPNSQWGIAGVVALAVLGVLLLAISSARWAIGGQPPADATAQIGQLMLGQFFLPFEAAAVLLLAAMIGAIVIARES